MKEEGGRKNLEIQNISTLQASEHRHLPEGVANETTTTKHYDTVHIFLFPKQTHTYRNTCIMATPSRLPSTRRPPGAAAGRSRPTSMIEVPLASPRDNS
jgi:hypothetical protein